MKQFSDLAGENEFSNGLCAHQGDGLLDGFDFRTESIVRAVERPQDRVSRGCVRVDRSCPFLGGVHVPQLGHTALSLRETRGFCKRVETFIEKFRAFGRTQIGQVGKGRQPFHDVLFDEGLVELLRDGCVLFDADAELFKCRFYLGQRADVIRERKTRFVRDDDDLGDF